MATIQFAAGLGPDGMPVAWTNRSVCDSIFATVRPDAIEGGIDRTSVEGLRELPYAIPHQRIDHAMRNSHVPVAFWRSVGSSQNAFALECFIDEVAHAGGKDPYELRRELLKDHADWLRVLDTIAERSDWGSPLPRGKGRGMAIHESFGTIVGEVAEVGVSQDGALKLERVVCAVDCGHVVNPTTVEMQMESSVVYGLTAALYGEITIDQGAGPAGELRHLRHGAHCRDAGRGDLLGAQRGRQMGRHRRAGRAADRAGGVQRDLRGDRQAHPLAAAEEPRSELDLSRWGGRAGGRPL
jgi:isoquinoline 1-oxidoreductase beta subunit